MSIEFATCVKSKALEYIQKVLPSGKITEDSINLLLDLVDKDILRVQDPFMYGSRIGIIHGKKYDTAFESDIAKAIKQISVFN